MRSTQDRKYVGRLLAWSSAAVLVAGSIGFTVPAFAAQPDNPSAHSAQGQGQAHSQATAGAHHATADRPVRAKSGSGVSLDKPNHYQAQSDPDGMTNGGVDQPGGTGGVDTTTQDGNNGSGNDADCEDDNRGVGVPGHCKDRPAKDHAEHPEHPEHPGTPDVPNAGGVPGPQAPGGDTPGDVLVPAEGGGAAGSTVLPSQLTTALAAAPGLDTTLVSAPTPRSVQTSTQARPQAAPATTAAGVLPNTGAGQALLGLSIAALAALAVGGGLVRRGRRTARVTS